MIRLFQEKTVLFALMVSSSLGVGSAVADTQTFKVDAAKSDVRVLVFKSGVASGLAHDHVIVSKSVKGEVKWNGDVAQAQVNLRIPVGSLIADETQYRKQEGDKFKTEISESDRKDIFETMTGDTVLDAKRYPDIIIQSSRVSGTVPNLQLEIQLNLHGVSKSLSIPVVVELQNGSIHAKGSISFKQSDFKIKPISLFLGSIKVQDEVQVKFDVVAIPQ